MTNQSVRVLDSNGIKIELWQDKGMTWHTTQEKEKIHASNREHLHAMARRLQEVLHHVEPRIELSLEKYVNRVILRVVDKESGDLIRQIPPEKVVELDRFFPDNQGF